LENRILTTLTAIQADVLIIKARQDDTHHRLFGNGQPGELASLDERVKDLELHDASDRGARNENKKWSAWIAAVVGAIVSGVFEWLTHRGAR
jgi:hypothetical protein